MTEIHTKSELIATLKESSQRTESWFRDIPASQFFTRHGDIWSPSNNLDHFIKAVKPITMAPRLPKLTLHAMFGKAEKASMTYEELCGVYRDAIANGGQASGRYLPNQKNPLETAGAEKEELLDRWSTCSAELVSTGKRGRKRSLTVIDSPIRSSVS